jgi:hypothetical protein
MLAADPGPAPARNTRQPEVELRKIRRSIPAADLRPRTGITPISEDYSRHPVEVQANNG